MEQKGKTIALKINIICFLIALLLSVLYLGGGKFLAGNEIYFRTWVVIIGELFVFVLTPLLLLLIPALAVAQAAKRRQTGGMRTAATVVWVLAGLIGFAYLAAGALVYAFLRADSIEREAWLAEGVIESVHTEYYGLQSYSVYRYYEPCTVFLKKTYAPMSEIMEKKAEELYGEKFTVSAQDKEREQQEKLAFYTLYPDSDPELVMHMYTGDTVYGFACDYPQARANRLMKQNEVFAAIAEFPQETGGGEDISPEAVLIDAPVVRIYSEGDGTMQAKAEVIAAAMQSVREDAFFAEHAGRDACLYLELWYEEGDTGRLTLYFNAMETEAGNAAEEAENVSQETEQLAADIIEQITQQYEKHAAELAKSGETEEGQTDGQPREEAAKEQTSDQSEEVAAEPQSVEGAYRCLYEQVFKEQGAVYDCRCDAKGNFYAFLAEGKNVPSSGTEELRTEYTVVYDRVSENGKCHLFVYYETFYNEDGTKYGTAILNTYAVNMETGEVTASGKQAWADIGTEAYQEATGEL